MIEGIDRAITAVAAVVKKEYPEVPDQVAEDVGLLITLIAVYMSVYRPDTVQKLQGR
jgi:hypothetical protein